MRDFLQFIKWAAIVGGSLVLAWMAFSAVFFHYTMSPTASVEKYETTVGKIKRREASRDAAQRDLGHFPERIPPSATDAKFFHTPGFRSGFKAQLLLTLPESEVAGIEQRLRAEHQPQPAELIRGRPHSFPEVWFKSWWLSESPSAETLRISDDFIWFDLSPAPVSPHDNRHVIYKGVALSKSKHQVFYWVSM